MLWGRSNGASRSLIALDLIAIDIIFSLRRDRRSGVTIDVDIAKALLLWCAREHVGVWDGFQNLARWAWRS